MIPPAMVRCTRCNKYWIVWKKVEDHNSLSDSSTVRFYSCWFAGCLSNLNVQAWFHAQNRLKHKCPSRHNISPYMCQCLVSNRLRYIQPFYRVSHTWSQRSPQGETQRSRRLNSNRIILLSFVSRYLSYKYQWILRQKLCSCGYASLFCKNISWPSVL